MKIKNAEQLENLLIANGIDFALWGQGNAKYVIDLWNEMISGESIIQENPLIRLVAVVQIVIRNTDGRILIEVEQELADGRIRSRNRAPAEKMKPAESYSSAAIRCLEEELGLSADKVKLIKPTYKQIQELKDSPSYPGLQSKYIFHIIEAKVLGLPDTDFWTDEATYNGKDPVRKHHWAWVEEKGIPS